MIYPCRCRKCRARRTLRQHPDNYVRRHFAVCYNCGADALALDTYRQQKEHKRTRCRCDAYHFPHRHDPNVCRFKVW